MGNTISTPPNMIFFAAPKTLLPPSSRPEYHHHPLHPKKGARFYILRPYPYSRALLDIERNEEEPGQGKEVGLRGPQVTGYKVADEEAKWAEVFGMLWALCNELRVGRIGDGGEDQGWEGLSDGDKPIAIFYLRGNFGNPACNSVLSVLLERKVMAWGEGGSPKMGENSTWPSWNSPRSSTSSSNGSTSTPRPISPRPLPDKILYSYLHIFEPTHLAQPFSSLLSSFASPPSSILSLMPLNLDETIPMALEADALFQARSWWEGIDNGEEGVGVMRRFEGRLGELWEVCGR
ncbi:hypothetical protein P154DRAFT_166011 [Amniculicola lignicola CBS 123094]|uniref:Uncharacterized protein n=1 Tax=Amniculicola lignicola CBS 123094 TaxID=1392246 RepID=A0A6A5WIV3_9PLEO|nr:hypothetical protein P154DRAFT_166011 [Amniculicola lignicola CBS 123094]